MKVVPNAEKPILPGSPRPSPAQRGRGEPGTDLGHEALVAADLDLDLDLDVVVVVVVVVVVNLDGDDDVDGDVPR